ncbi:MAG: RnfABCDGE type electron transport complex subunit D [bacterium]|nr:RnfABCDGE type electron transport complex subunit D [bacterium]
MARLLHVSSSPHLRTSDSIPKIMWTVVIALLPLCVFAVWLFGWYAALLIAICVATAVLTEGLMQKLRKQKLTLYDGSAVVMGILVACNLPPGISWWIPIIGTFVGMAIAKHCYGGLGYNIFNPALIARAFLLAAYPKDMTTWISPVDATTCATPLGILKERGPGELLSAYGGKLSLYKHLFIGNIPGCLGETSALLILAGGVFLLLRGIITWHIPLSYLATLALLTFLSGGDPIIALLAGGVMLGAWFMATDLVTSPFTRRGQVVFGIGCGLLTFLIRRFSGYPEGTSYAILLMNAATPLIDRYFPNRIYGTR